MSQRRRVRHGGNICGNGVPEMLPVPVGSTTILASIVEFPGVVTAVWRTGYGSGGYLDDKDEDGNWNGNGKKYCR